MNKVVIVLICLIGAVFFFSRDYKKSEISIGTNAEFPPFTFIENGKIVGFDIDIIEEVMRRLGKKFEIKDMPFDALLSDFKFGNIQIIAAGLTPTEERKKYVFFTNPHLSNDPLVILTLNEQKENIHTVDDLINKTVAVNDGFTADIFLSAKPGINLIRLASLQDGFLALKSKRVDAFVTAKSTTSVFLASQNRDLFTVSVVDGTDESYAFAISKKYPDLILEVQNELDKMEKDGTMAQIKEKWKLS